MKSLVTGVTYHDLAQEFIKQNEDNKSVSTIAGSKECKMRNLNATMMEPGTLVPVSTVVEIERSLDGEEAPVLDSISRGIGGSTSISIWRKIRMEKGPTLLLVSKSKGNQGRGRAIPPARVDFQGVEEGVVPPSRRD